VTHEQAKLKKHGLEAAHEISAYVQPASRSRKNAHGLRSSAPWGIHGVPKNKNKSDAPTYLLCFDIFMVFLGSSCEKRPKARLNKVDGKRRQEKMFFPQLFRPEAFLIFNKCMVFLNSPC
jgi:hypothetical protein